MNIFAHAFLVICERKGYTRCYFYCLYHIKLHRKNQRYSYKNVGGKFLRPPDILLDPFFYRNTAFEHDHDFPFFHHADILDQQPHRPIVVHVEIQRIIGQQLFDSLNLGIDTLIALDFGLRKFQLFPQSSQLICLPFDYLLDPPLIPFRSFEQFDVSVDFSLDRFHLFLYGIGIQNIVFACKSVREIGHDQTHNFFSISDGNRQRTADRLFQFFFIERDRTFAKFRSVIDTAHTPPHLSIHPVSYPCPPSVSPCENRQVMV